MIGQKQACGPSSEPFGVESRQLYGGAAPWACAGRGRTPACAITSDIPGISIEMMAIDHSDASALVDVHRTSSAAVRQATASAVNRYCPQATFERMCAAGTRPITGSCSRTSDGNREVRPEKRGSGISAASSPWPSVISTAEDARQALGSGPTIAICRQARLISASNQGCPR